MDGHVLNHTLVEALHAAIPMNHDGSQVPLVCVLCASCISAMYRLMMRICSHAAIPMKCDGSQVRHPLSALRVSCTFQYKVHSLVCVFVVVGRAGWRVKGYRGASLTRNTFPP